MSELANRNVGDYISQMISIQLFDQMKYLFAVLTCKLPNSLDTCTHKAELLNCRYNPIQLMDIQTISVYLISFIRLRLTGGYGK